MKYEQKEIEIRVLDCPLMIEGNSPLTWVTLPFCERCDHHEGMELGIPLCSANSLLKEDPETQGTEEKTIE